MSDSYKTEIRRKTLMRKFTWIFLFFVMVSLLMNGIFTFISQNNAYNERCRYNLENVSRSIAERIVNEKTEFFCLQKNFRDFKNDILIEYDFNGDYSPAKNSFYKYFNANYPDKILFDSISFDEMDRTAQTLWMTYVYEKWLFCCESMRDSFDLNYVYFIFPVSDKEMCYMIDGVRMEKKIGDKSFIDLGYEGEIDRENHQNMWETWETKAVTGDVDVTRNEYGNVYTSYYPVIVDGVIIGMTAAESDIDITNAMIFNAVWKQSLIYIIVLGLSSLLALMFISKTIIIRIVQLDKQIQTYSQTKDPGIGEIVNKYAEVGSDEISTLGKNFADMTRELEEHMENLQIVTAERERIGTELSVATNIQASMLPQDYTDCEKYSLYAKMDPAKEVGGDFYDFFMVDEDHIALVIADVAGKGVPASLFMVIAKTLIKNHTRNKESVEEAFYNTNNQLGESNGEGLFVTAWLGVLNINTGVLKFVEAGHEYPYIVTKNGEVTELRPLKKKMPLASFENMKYIPNEIQLNHGDKLFLYTDGVPEATNTENELYGIERTKAVLSKSAGLSPKEMLQFVRRDVDTFVGDAPQFDDLTMLAIEFK